MNRVKKFFKQRFPWDKKRSGVILISVVWVLVILSFLSLSLGLRTRVNTSLWSHAIGRIKAKYLAWAGIIYAIEQIRQDSVNKKYKTFDNLYYCGLKGNDRLSLENSLKRHELGDGYFSISYFADKNIEGIVGENQRNIDRRYSFQDEERFININTIDTKNIEVLIFLMKGLGIERKTAEVISFSILDWRDSDQKVRNAPFGAEDEYYMSLNPPYKAKNFQFESLEELLLVRGVTPEIFAKLKNHITIFPKSRGFFINFDTASKVILEALVMAANQLNQGQYGQAVDSLVEKIIDYRKGPDALEFTMDDLPINFQEFSLSTEEKKLLLPLKKIRKRSSGHLRVRSRGVDVSRKVISLIEVIIRRKDLAIVFWRRT